MNCLVVIATDATLRGQLAARLGGEDRQVISSAPYANAQALVESGAKVAIVGLSDADPQAQLDNFLLLLRTCRHIEPYFEAIVVGPMMLKNGPLTALRGGCFDYIDVQDDSDYLLARVIEACCRVNARIEQDNLVQSLVNGAERYELAARGANDGLWDWDRRRNTMYLSPRWKSILGYAEDELSGDPDEWMGLIHPDDRERIKQAIEDHVAQRTEVFHDEFRMRHRDGYYRWLSARGLAVYGLEGVATRIVGSQSDVTDRKIAERQLVYDAFYDRLTGLPNQVRFRDRISDLLSRSLDAGHEAVVTMVGIDGFHVINESLGPHAGDDLLISVARRLQAHFPEADHVARMGGDEFAVFVEREGSPRSPHRASSEAIDLVLRAFEAPVVVHQKEVFVTVGIGAAAASESGGSALDLVRDASIALHRAKALGAGRRAIFKHDMRHDAKQRLELETALRRAIEHDQFELMYQPIFKLRTGGVEGFEALIRWNHPQRGVLTPQTFIPLAERNGLIIDIGAWALRQACKQAAKWSELTHTPLRVSVNVSQRQLMSRGFVECVHAALEEASLPPSSLKIEVTETVLINDFEAAAHTLETLKRLGVVLVMDDFGTGYSALSYLHRLPFDVVKIDRSFVTHLADNDRNTALVEGTVSLAHGLGLEVVAEGIETGSQLELLRAMRCDYGQGYFFDKPLNTAQVQERLTHEKTPQS